MIVFFDPISAGIIGAGAIGRAIGGGQNKPDPVVIKRASPKGDVEAERKATEEANRRARAAAATSRADSVLTPAAAPQTRRRTLLGVS